MLDDNNNLKYQLETLASFEPEDIDRPEFEVGYESNEGAEGFATICCIELAQRSLERIVQLERELIQAGEDLLDERMEYRAEQERSEG